MDQPVDAAMHPELASVVMPCFNARAFVEQAVRSALGQDYADVELIVVDDGSTDGSREVLARLAGEYAGRMTVLQQNNQGPYPARNAGLRHAQGSLVAFLDADDYWAPNCLDTLWRALRAAQADLAYCGWQNVGEGGPGKEPYVPPHYEAGDTVALFLKGCPWPIHAALMRRSVLEQVGGFSTRMFSSMDYDLWLRILAVGEMAPGAGCMAGPPGFRARPSGARCPPRRRRSARAAGRLAAARGVRRVLEARPRLGPASFPQGGAARILGSAGCQVRAAEPAAGSSVPALDRRGRRSVALVRR
jgi:hypothetical protein